MCSINWFFKSVKSIKSLFVALTALLVTIGALSSAAAQTRSDNSVAKGVGLGPADDSWFLESNAISLDPSNRFIGSLTATNPGRSPVYVRVTVEKLELKDNKRVRSVDSQSALRAFPSEFMLRPGESFPVRLLVNLAGQPSNSQSYYVKLEDVSNVALAKNNSSGVVGAAFILAYEAMVSVHKSPIEKLLPEHFSLSRLASGEFGLTNLSGQHIYLNRGDACPDSKTALVECVPVIGFPRQTMLPDEMLKFPRFDAPFIGILANAKLNMRVRSSLIHLQTPREN